MERSQRRQMVYKFPGVNCISVNDEAVHGIPGNRALVNGDVVKLDVTIEKNGFMADAAESIAVGAVAGPVQELIDCAERAFTKSMLVARAGFRVSEIGRVVEREVRRCGFSVIRDLGGHGIGRTIHEAPRVPNYPDPDVREILTEGLVITIAWWSTTTRLQVCLDTRGLWTSRAMVPRRRWLRFRGGKHYRSRYVRYFN
jgi:methionyl aminopeptidase